VIVETDGKLRLSGKVLADGGSPPTEVGFLLSHTLGIDSTGPDLVRLGATLSNGNFTLLAQHPESLGKRIYARAYARNSAGESYGAPKRLRIPENNIQESAWLNGAENVTGGWRLSSWFGTFLPFGNGWLYHEEWGWLYAQDDHHGGIWLWKKDLGWLWTTKDVYPYLHHHESSEWLYFLKASNGKVHFIRPNANVVESVVK
jgi:hypothetical protein